MFPPGYIFNNVSIKYSERGQLNALPTLIIYTLALFTEGRHVMYSTLDFNAVVPWEFVVTRSFKSVFRLQA